MTLLARLERCGARIGDRTLDVGCGERPFPLATHLADRRWPPPRDRRPFVRCAVEALPFRDRAFDFVYCSHVLEHVRDPAAACAELSRVAPRGYVECPRSWIEHLFEAEDHRWLVDFEAGTLIFREKLPEERGDLLGIQYEIFRWLREPAFGLRWSQPAARRARNVECRFEGKLPALVLSAAQRRGEEGLSRARSGTPTAPPRRAPSRAPRSPRS